MLKRIRRQAKEALLRVRPAIFWRYVYARHGYLEPEMALLPRLCLRDRVSIDVGANYGVYCYYMLKYSGTCIAFEPYPDLAQLLKRGYGKRLQVHQVALSNRSGITQMVASTAQSGHNTIEPSNRVETKVDDPASLVTLDVPVRRLDEFDLGPVGFIKIDVQGHEPEVIGGAIETIGAYRPTLLVEAEEQHRAGAREALMAQLEQFGYRGFFMDSSLVRPIEDFDVDRHQNPARPADYVRNFLFIPEHGVSQILDRMGPAS